MGQPAARIGDKVLQSGPHCHAPIHPAALVPTPLPHPPMPLTIASGSPNVMIGGMPAARVTDQTVPCMIPACVPGGPGIIGKGSAGVMINGLPAARAGDMTMHAACVGPIPGPTGNIIPPCCPTVLIGDVGGGGGGGGAGAGGAGAGGAGGSGAGAAAAAAAAPAGSAPAPASTGLGKDVDALAAKSPTLTNNIDALKKDGWTIEYGPAGKGSFTDRTAKKIVIDSNEKGDANAVAQTLAHESGHARYTPDPYVPPTGLTRDQYVQRNVDRSLKDEGEATMTNAQVRQEILKNGGPDIGIAGAQANQYARLAAQYPDPNDRDKAREAIGQVFANGEHPSTDPSKTYGQYYAAPFEKYWDQNVAKKP